MEKYGDVLRLYANSSCHPHAPKSIEEWKSDPSVLSITDEGLPPGWVKIIRQYRGGKEKRVIFKSPSKGMIR
jgi:hypothetical protein